ncbi:MAG: sugar phosphate isomerase/epimerase, partial [Oscillospiraceae bacterium]
RYYDTVELYKHYFNAANILGANIVVIHGSRIPGVIETQEYYERFGNLIDEGQKQGIIVAHENVVGTMGQAPQRMIEMQKAIGDKFKIVFDIKQSVRSGFQPIEFIEQLYKQVVQVHISDHNDEFDCLPPGEGNFNFADFIHFLTDKGYNGDYIIELYNHSFSNYNQLLDSKEYIQSLKW